MELEQMRTLERAQRFAVTKRGREMGDRLPMRTGECRLLWALRAAN